MFHVDVVDSGIGMNPQQLEKVFSPFTQADVSTTRRFGGTGLGLTISRQLAVRMGGKLFVKSQPDIGSTFTLIIPNDFPAKTIGQQVGDSLASKLQIETKGTLSMDSTPPSLIGTIRVLLAEDGPDNQRLISLILTAAKMHVDIADNGQIAFEKAMAAQQADQPYHVILMDMQMPVLDGLAATRQLREAGYQRPVVSLTANAMESDRRRCLDAGCDDYAQKPINRQMLIATIVKYATQPVARDAVPQNAASPAINPSPLVSEWANDPDMAELVHDYVMNLPTRVAAISAALSSEQMDELRTLVHQVKGSAGGYGFNPISEQAGQVEMLVHSQAQMERIRKEVDALVDLCNRASAS
jgi:CheY-like chemotaxis protein/HPt (histidine-containing phosphotransfer) domain-containing protein